MEVSFVHYLGMALVIGGTLGYSIFSARNVKSADGFSLVGRAASTPLVAGGIVGVIIGGGATVGTAQLAYQAGLCAWSYSLGAGLGFLVQGIFYARKLRSTNLETVPEFFGLHYGKYAAPVISVCGTLSMLCGNHLIHSARRNMDLTAIIVNNFNYGMTGGQYSATTPSDAITSTSPTGNPERSFDLVKLLVAAGASYVARETVVNGVLLKNRIKKGIQKQGFSAVEAISPCTTLFGPRNKMKQPVAMLRHLKEKGVPRAKFSNMENPEAEGFFATGEFADSDAEDFLTRYEAARARMTARKGGGNG